jgi:hypothetical protein
LWLAAALAPALLVWVPVAEACPLCLEAARQMVTVGIQLDAANQSVLAIPVAGGARLRVVEVVKGSHAVGDVLTEPVTAADGTVPAGRGPLLLIEDPIAPRWFSLGTLPASEAEWLRRMVATAKVAVTRPALTGPTNLQTPLTQTLSDAGWRERVAIVVPCLEKPAPLAAQIAWGELARAPYADLEVVRTRVDPLAVTRWLADPRLAARHATYTLLLGFVGRPADAARLERQIDAARSVHETKDLAAMLAADLELRGASRVDWIEAKYFADRSRSMAEIEAVLLALHVHGDANRTVPRARVIQAYHAFIAERPPLAGFVAPELADWNYWGATTQYHALLKSKRLSDPASEVAVVDYLRRADAARGGLH